MVQAGEAVGSAAVSGVSAVGSATVSAGKAVGSSVSSAVDDSTTWVREKRRSVILHAKKTIVHTVEEEETIGIIAAKYKTTPDVIFNLNGLPKDGEIAVGMELKVPVSERRKASKNRSSVDLMSMDFISSVANAFTEEEEACSAMDIVETRCIIMGSAGPLSVIQGYLILEQDSLVLSWGKNDPVNMAKEKLTNLVLVYGPNEMADFVSFHQGTMDSASMGHSISEDVFPIHNEEPELEEAEADLSVGTEDGGQSQHLLTESDDLSLSGSVKNMSFDDRSSIGGHEEEAAERAEKATEPPSEKVANGSTSERCGEDSRSSASFHRRSRRRTISKERRRSLLFDDSMATYLYVELDPDSLPPAVAAASEKARSGRSPSKGSGGEGSGGSGGSRAMSKSPSSSRHSASSSDDIATFAPPAAAVCISSQQTFKTAAPAFIVRVPNEVVVKLFSLLIRHYGDRYGSSEPGVTAAGYTVLSMETLQNRDGDTKVSEARC